MKKKPKVKSLPTPLDYGVLAARIANNAALNAIEIVRELPDEWIERHSVFHYQNDRIADAAVYMAKIEQEEGFAWNEGQNTDWESACHAIGKIVQELPEKKITEKRIRACTK